MHRRSVFRQLGASLAGLIGLKAVRANEAGGNVDERPPFHVECGQTYETDDARLKILAREDRLVVFKDCLFGDQPHLMPRSYLRVRCNYVHKVHYPGLNLVPAGAHVALWDVLHVDTDRCSYIETLERFLGSRPESRGIHRPL
jgi:hypothetical protein